MQVDRSVCLRVSAAAREQLERRARATGRSISAIVREIVETAIGREERSEPALAGPTGVRPARITARLDGVTAERLASRAHARGLRRSTYAVHVLSAHVHDAPRLPDAEVAELKRLANQIAHLAGVLRDASTSGSIGAHDLESALRTVESVRGAVANVVRANAESWSAPRA